MNDREYWVDVTRQLADPLLNSLERRELKTTMPIETYPGAKDPKISSPLEALGRLLMGIGPWLELGDDGSPEGTLRTRYAILAREAIDAATDPSSPDRMDFQSTGQALVDSAILAHAILRAPKALWETLPKRVQDNLANALAECRAIVPCQNNWILFSATVEVALRKMGRPWSPMRLRHYLHTMDRWYVGDGLYGDGPVFANDYYNSFVIHPMLLDILAEVGDRNYFGIDYGRVLGRARRYAEIQERSISPEGALPVVGRSLAYRFGILHALAWMTLKDKLPSDVTPAQVRCAMTTVIRRHIEAPNTFDENGWLRIGFCGAQPSIGERYISTGSLYFCAAGLLPLGLPESDPFWSDPSALWTSQKFYSGVDVSTEHRQFDSSELNFLPRLSRISNKLSILMVTRLTYGMLRWRR